MDFITHQTSNNIYVFFFQSFRSKDHMIVEMFNDRNLC
jgi:hypothetical protein